MSTKTCAAPTCRTSLDEHPVTCPHGIEFCGNCTWEETCSECAADTEKPPTITVYDDLGQRSDEWYEVRRGIVTASLVGKLLTTESADPLAMICPDCGAVPGILCMNLRTRQPIKGIHDGRSKAASSEPSRLVVADNDTSRAITANLVAERITGITEPSYITDDMLRGIEAEPFARDIYSGHYEQAVEVGFIKAEGDGWTLGVSPDGLVGTDGGLEIKAPRAKGHILTILADEVPAQHMGQIQAALLVTGRDWWDFVSYHAGLPLYVKRVHPDPDWFDAIKAACITFERKAVEMVADYEHKTARLPKTERIDYEIQVA